MRRSLSILSLAAVSAGGAAHAAAAPDLVVTLDLPRKSVAEYHRPYVAVWLEGPDQAAAATLSVWYETERAEHGQRYLKELRQWWRKTGRGLSFPIDGISGATRAPGPQTVVYRAGVGALAGLAPGQYTLVVEAAREVGDHESVRLPFTWPLKRGQAATAAGTSELGMVRLAAR